MMRSVPLVFWALLMAVPAVSAEDQGSCLDALRKIFPDSETALSSAAKWLEDNFGAATADDLKGISNFAVDGMSLANSDANLDVHTKNVLKRLFSNGVGDEPKQSRDAMDVLKSEFPDVGMKVLIPVAKWLEDNFGASTAEDLDGVSNYAVNGLTLIKEDKILGADEKKTLQLLFQIRSQEKRRLHGSSSSSSMAPATTTTTTTTMAATTTTTAAMDATTTTTTGATAASGGGDTGGDSGSTDGKDSTGGGTGGDTGSTDGKTTGGDTGSTDGKTTGGTTGGDTGSTDGKTSGGGSDATTTTTTMAAPTTTTTLGEQKFNAILKMTVTDVEAFLADMPKAKKVMQAAIAAGNDQVTSADMVMVNDIKKVTAGSRRLGDSRRLAAGELEVDYTVTFPPTYSGVGITEGNTDFSKMIESIKNNDQGIKVEASGFAFTKPPACSGGCGPTTTAKATTTAATEIGGAVTGKQLATSAAAVLLIVNLL